MVVFEKSKDFYKVLQVPREATITEIKVSYRKLALRLHPDIHKDDPKKTAEFIKVSEAYAVLSDEDKKNSYDYSIGIRFNKNRRTAPPPNYRSIVFPKPPKEWKSVWDHQKHYDMHYGDGMYQEIMEQIKKRAEKEGLLQYRSPIGPGFAFCKEKPELNRNPFSKTTAPHGTPRIVIDYEESYINMSSRQQSGKKEQFKRYARVVEDLNGQREQRRAYQSKTVDKQKKPENAAFQSDPLQGCVIL